MEVTTPEGVFELIQSNPQKVGLDRDGNGPSNKCMVKRRGGDGWIGQVRQYLGGKPCWHFHSFQDSNYGRRGA